MSTNILNGIQSHQRIFIQGGAATPLELIRRLIAEAPRLNNVELMHLHTMGDAAYAKPEFAKNFKVVNLFVGSNMRDKMNYENVDYLPCSLSEIPRLFSERYRPLDVAFVHVSPPDILGNCSLGVSVDVARAAVDSAHIVIAQINPQMPRVLGDGIINVKKFTHTVEVDEALPTTSLAMPSSVDKAIGQFAAELVSNGSTLQVGIGSVPDAILASLQSHRRLGIHSEMWSDGVLKLIESGAVDNSEKKLYQGKSVSGFVIGSRKLYDYINNNSDVIQLNTSYVNDPQVIRKNPKVVAINSAVEIDLTGQVCADSIGPRIISGAGGQMDFINGAALSDDGKSIIALTSRTRHGVSRIVAGLKTGAGVVSPRSHVHYIITEYGVADLFGKTLAERAKALINIAHPDDREALSKSWHDHFRT